MKLSPKLAVIATLLASGCAGLPPEAEQQLAGAREVYSRAAADAQVQRYAPLELQSAANALQAAERQAKDRNVTLVQHNAYLAERRARTAIANAQARQAELQAEGARTERRRVEREAHEREAAAAREREAAAAREREAAAARAQAEQAAAARREAEARSAALEQEKLEAREQTAAAELAAEMKKLETGLPGAQGRQTPRGWVLAFSGDVLFERGTTLRGAAGAALNDIADFLRKYPDRLVAIEGFSDGQGGKEAERLSERRAEAVKAALMKRGVEPYRIHARGYGEAAAGASNDSEDGQQLNRRVEIVISPS